MKIKYDKPKKLRVNRYFIGLTCKSNNGETYWYYEDIDKWYLNYENVGEYNGYYGNYNSNVHTLKTAIRKIKKYSKHLPKGTIFILDSEPHTSKDTGVLATIH